MNKYKVRVEFSKTVAEFGEIEIYANSKKEAKKIAHSKSMEIDRRDMFEGDEISFAVDNTYDDWDIEPVERKEK